MRTLFGILLSFSLLSCEQLSAPSQTSTAVDPIHSKHGKYTPSGLEFSVENQTSVNIGMVTIYLNNNTSTSLAVPGSGTFGVEIPVGSTYCVINGQTLYYNIPAWIVINSTTSVHATLGSNVIIVDQSEQS